MSYLQMFSQKALDTVLSTGILLAYELDRAFYKPILFTFTRANEVFTVTIDLDDTCLMVSEGKDWINLSLANDDGKSVKIESDRPALLRDLVELTAKEQPDMLGVLAAMFEDVE